MLKHGIEKGLFDANVIQESLLSMKRAGADRIITYFTPEILKGS